MTLDLNLCGMRDKGCKLRVYKASHRGPGGPTARTARASVSSTAPTKASFSYSTQFPASLPAQICLLGVFCAFQANQETFVLLECPCCGCRCSVWMCVHAHEGDKVHLRDAEAKYKFLTTKEHEKSQFLPSGEKSSGDTSSISRYIQAGNRR